MDIVVNEELRAYIDPMTPDEHEALERSILGRDRDCSPQRGFGTGEVIALDLERGLMSVVG